MGKHLVEELGEQRISHVTRQLQDLGLTAHAARHVASYPEPLRTLAAAYTLKGWRSIKETGRTARDVLKEADEQARKDDEQLMGVSLPPSPLNTSKSGGSLSDWLKTVSLRKEGVPLEWAENFVNYQRDTHD